MSDTTIAEIFGLRTKPFVYDYGYKGVTLPEIKSNEIIGIEVEVENVRDAHLRKLKGVWEHKEDGSLRNNGREFVTKPIPASNAPSSLYHLLVNALDNECSFNMRTSVHVHLNVQDLTCDQVRALIGVYMIFENTLFSFVGRGRSKSVFCVPLTQCIDVSRIKDGRYMGHGWNKYTALNLRRIQDLGTVEFRHMAGTFSVEKLSSWIGMIVSLKEYVKKFGAEEIQKLITKQIDRSYNFTRLMFDVFGDYAHELGGLTTDSVFYRNAVNALQVYNRGPIKMWARDNSPLFLLLSKKGFK